MNEPPGGPLVTADPDDVEDLAALWAQAFPARGPAERVRELREGMTYGSLADCWLARDGGRVVGALRAYRLTLHARGRSWPTMGLAAVAVAPDARRRGLGRRMCAHALRIGRERGCVIAALFPFRTSFYADLGFALVGTLLRHRFDPGDLPTYPGWDRVRRAEDPAELRSIYQRAARGSTGLIDRPELAWRFLADPNASAFVHHDPAGKPTGYAVVQVRPGAAADRLRVVELVALDRAAHEGLLGWISSQRDQFREIVYDALPGEGLDRRLRHPRRRGSGRPRGLWFDSGTLLRGPMLRLLAPNAVQGGDARVGFGLLDTELPGCAGRWVAGRRAGGPGDTLPGEEVMGPGEAADRLVHGRLPGQLPPPEGWCPIPFGEEFRLLDEF
jgi:predicted N-acetyltransferase YhbS